MYIPKNIPESDRLVMQEKYRSKSNKPVIFGTKPALLIVDMTNGFVEDRFPTGFSQTGVPCAESIAIILQKARAINIPVIYTHDMNVPSEVYKLYRGAWNFKSDPIDDSVRADHNTIYPAIRPLPTEIVIEKAKPSAFFGTALLEILLYLGVDSIIVTGMVTSGCIRATVVDAFSYNFHVNVPVECVADRSQISHEVSLFDISAKYANVMSLKQVIEHLEA